MFSLVIISLVHTHTHTLSVNGSENLKNLKKIDLFGNQLTSLPPEVKEWKDLEWINLSGNQLTSLPPEVKEWKNLKNIDLPGKWKNLQPIVGIFAIVQKNYLSFRFWRNLFCIPLVWILLHYIRKTFVFARKILGPRCCQFRFTGILSNNECIICFEQFLPSSMVIKLRCACKIAYCVDCFHKWGTCAICRKSSNKVVDKLNFIIRTLDTLEENYSCKTMVFLVAAITLIDMMIRITGYYYIY